MRIESVRIENFRAFKDVEIPFGSYVCFVGPNGAGKSTVINALNVFFREHSPSLGDDGTLVEEDFHKRNTSMPIQITVTFCELSDEAQSDFKDYYRQGKLVVTAEAHWNENSATAEVKQLGQRLGMQEFRRYFEADKSGAKADDLKRIYNDLKEKFAALPAPASKARMEEALQSYEADHSDDCDLIPSPDQFYGVSRGVNRLEKHIQWVYIPAVKDASEEQTESKNTALGKLLARTVRSKTKFDEDIKELRKDALEQYQQILDNNQDALKDISNSLTKRLTEWAHPGASLDLQWQQDPKKSVSIVEPFAGIAVGEDGFSGSLSHLGHGLQRSYLLTILHELAGCDDEDGPRLILACEEPELYQHPPQVRHLAEVLQDLADHRSQILVCTHSPRFVSGEGFENVRMVRKDKDDGAAQVTHKSFTDISIAISQAQGKDYVRTATGLLAKINQSLQPSLNEIFFSPVLILVEGLEDVAYVMTHFHLMDKWSEFRRLGCHIVPTHGKRQMVMPMAIAKELRIPTFVVFDADGNPAQKKNREQHEKDNKTLLKLAGSPPEPFPDDIVWGKNLAVWPSNIGDTFGADIDKEILDEVRQEAHTHFGHTDGLKKNELFIARTLTSAWEKGQKSSSLLKLCNNILEFASGK